MYAAPLRVALGLLAGAISIAAIPSVAEAHGGSTAPVATNYLAKVNHVPTGLDAKVVDGDLRLWLARQPSR